MRWEKIKRYNRSPLPVRKSAPHKIIMKPNVVMDLGMQWQGCPSAMSGLRFQFPLACNQPIQLSLPSLVRKRVLRKRGRSNGSCDQPQGHSPFQQPDMMRWNLKLKILIISSFCSSSVDSIK